MSSESDEFDDVGPIDYLVVEYPGNHPTGEALPYLVDLVDRGLIRILDLVRKDPDGSVAAVELANLTRDDNPDLAVFEGAPSGLLGQDDLEEAGTVIGPGSTAAIVLYENLWGRTACPCHAAQRRSPGGRRKDSRAGLRRGARLGGGRGGLPQAVKARRAQEVATMPGLLRGVARTTAVAGTATAVSNRVSRRQAGRWARQDAQQTAPAQPPPASPEDKIALLKELGELKTQGVLTYEEFEDQKHKILSG